MATPFTNDLGDYGYFDRQAPTDEREILYSYSPPPLRKGGFLAAGEGELVAGTVLSYDDDAGLWFKYTDVGPTDEVQTITSGASPPTEGTATVTFRGVTSAPIAFDATAAAWQAALEDMSSIGEGNVVVSGGPLSAASTALTLTFAGSLSAQDLPQIELTDTFDQAVTVATATPGVTAGGTAAGVLVADADSGDAATGRNTAINIYLRAQLKTDQLVGLDANAKTDLRAYEPAGAYGCTVIG